MGEPLLTGLRVVELVRGTAGLLTGALLADHGADVVHVLGAGDPLPAGWPVRGRGKRVARATTRSELDALVGTADVLVADRSVDGMVDVAAGLIVLELDDEGTDADAQARSGVAHLTGAADGPPAFAGWDLAGGLSSLMGVLGVMAALHRRDSTPGRPGERITLATFETPFRMVDWLATVHDQLGQVPTRSGNRVAFGSEVVDTYRSADGVWLIVSAGTPRALDGLRRLTGGATAAAVTAWVAARTASACESELSAGGVSVSRVLSVDEVVADPTFVARGSVVEVDGVRMPAALPHLRNHPGTVRGQGLDSGA